MSKAVVHILIVGLVQMGLCFLSAKVGFWMARYYELESEGYDGNDLFSPFIQRLLAGYRRYQRKSDEFWGRERRSGTFSKSFLRFGVKWLKFFAWCWVLGGIIFYIDMVARLGILLLYA